VRVLRRDLDQLLDDAEEPSSVEEHTVSDEPDTHEGWRDARQFDLPRRPAETYAMNCAPAGSGITCSGGNNASVTFPSCRTATSVVRASMRRKPTE
jgi:hypothetical protein